MSGPSPPSRGRGLARGQSQHRLRPGASRKYPRKKTVCRAFLTFASKTGEQMARATWHSVPLILLALWIIAVIQIARCKAAGAPSRCGCSSSRLSPFAIRTLNKRRLEPAGAFGTLNDTKPHTHGDITRKRFDYSRSHSDYSALRASPSAELTSPGEPVSFWLEQVSSGLRIHNNSSVPDWSERRESNPSPVHR